MATMRWQAYFLYTLELYENEDYTTALSSYAMLLTFCLYLFTQYNDE